MGPNGHVYVEIEVVERLIATMLCSLMRGVSSDLVFAGPLCVSILLLPRSLARVPNTADHGHDGPDKGKIPSGSQILDNDILHVDILVVLVGIEISVCCGERGIVGWLGEPLLGDHALILIPELPVIRKGTRFVQLGNLLHAGAKIAIRLRYPAAECLDRPVPIL